MLSVVFIRSYCVEASTSDVHSYVHVVRACVHRTYRTTFSLRAASQSRCHVLGSGQMRFFVPMTSRDVRKSIAAGPALKVWDLSMVMVREWVLVPSSPSGAMLYITRDFQMSINRG